MGRQHRVNVSFVAALSVLGALGAGCRGSDTDRRAEIKRELLRAENLAQRRLAEDNARRVADANGDLLPSNTQLAGITIPRGYSPKFVHEREWTYDAELPFHKLEQYFMQRLSAKVEHPAGLITRFTQARPIGEPNALPVEVEVMPVPGRLDWSSFHIIQPAPPPATAPQRFSEIAADIEAKRRNAF